MSDKAPSMAPHETAQRELRSLADGIDRLKRLADKIEGQKSAAAIPETTPDSSFRSLQPFLTELTNDCEALKGRLNEETARIENALYS